MDWILLQISVQYFFPFPLLSFNLNYIKHIHIYNFYSCFLNGLGGSHKKVMITQFSHKLTLFYGTFIDIPNLNSQNCRIRSYCVVGVSRHNGTIVFIEENFHGDLVKLAQSWDPILTANEINIINHTELGQDGFFFPGFIDTHIHASQYPNSGLFGKTTLLDWLNEYTFPLESKLFDLNIANQIYNKIIKRTLSYGTTTAAYYTTIHLESSKLMARLCLKYNQRAYIGKICMNQNSPSYYIESSARESIDTTTQLIDYIKELNDSRISPVITPRFAPSCDETLLSQLGQLAKQNNLPIQTHLSENVNEIEWVEQLFPKNSNYTDVYDKNGLLTQKTILAHCIHLNEDELNVIRNQKSGISHCPISNSCLGSGECPTRKILNKGIDIGLGTDISAGYSPSILEVARHAHMVSRHLSKHENNDSLKLSIVECLYLATMGGAHVMGLQDTIGSFDVNKQFDSQFIDLTARNSPIDLFPWEKQTEKLEKWFFNGDDRNVITVWVGGVESGLKSKPHL